MSKIRIYDLAKEMGVAPKELANQIKKMGYDIRSHSSTLSEEDVQAVKNRLEAEGWLKERKIQDEKQREKAPKKSGIIIRRAREREPEKGEEEGPGETKPLKPKLRIKLVIKRPVKKEEIGEKPVEKAPEVSKEPTVEGPHKLGVSPKEEAISKPGEALKGAKESLSQEVPPQEEIHPKREEIKQIEAKRSIEEEKKEKISKEFVRGPKVVARPVGVVKEVVRKEEKKPHEKTKRPPRIVTDFKKTLTERLSSSLEKSTEKVSEKKKKPRKKQIIELEEFRKKKSTKKRITKSKTEREEILEELELMKELEEMPDTLELSSEKEEEAEVDKAKKEREKKEAPETPSTLPRKEKKIKVYESIQVGDLAKLMGVKASDIIRKFMEMGTMVTITQSIDPETAAIVAAEFGYEVEQAPIEEEQLIEYIPPAPEELEPRPPVITVMGHVDHGKTTMLDAIRQTDVAAKEAGGITQYIGAYKVRLKGGQEITFIDTPGHEAFTSMRARGSQVTDIVILVVAADDGVMDQTREAIDHARAAGVPVVVAINKIDKPEANPERVKTELAELGLVPEEWGGETLYAEISAKKRIGIHELLDLVLLQAEMLELKACRNRPARGRIIESRLDRGRGPVATIIVQEGTLREGDPFVAGTTYGRVRAMLDEHGKRVKHAGPSTPVEVLGFSEVPHAGDDFIVMPDEQKARKVAEYRARKQREAEVARESKMSLEKLFEKLREGKIKELKAILKADVQGTLEALADSLRKLSTDEVEVNIIRTGIGAVSESDVMLAAASDAIIIGFNVRPTAKAKNLAREEKVEIRFYDVIYKVIEDVKKAMSGLLEPEYEEQIMGIAEVRATFKIPKVGVVAGCYVKEGKIERGAKARLLRDNVVIYTGKIASLRRFKEDVKEVVAGYECGVGLENFHDIKVDDIIETYKVIEIKREV